MSAKYHNGFSLRTNQDGTKIAYAKIWAEILTQEEFDTLLHISSEDYKYYYDRYADALVLEGIVEMKVNAPIKHSYYCNTIA